MHGAEISNRHSSLATLALFLSLAFPFALRAGARVQTHVWSALSALDADPITLVSSETELHQPNAFIKCAIGAGLTADWNDLLQGTKHQFKIMFLSCISTCGRL